MVEKKIIVDGQFYGEAGSYILAAPPGRCVVAAFSVCTVLDSCPGDIPGCARHTPCSSDHPCTRDNPCSNDHPCSNDTPTPSVALDLTGGSGEFTWEIYDLGNPFNAKNYKRVGITKDKFTVGNVTSISGIVDFKNAPASGSSTTVSKTIDYPPGTYTFWGFAETPIDASGSTKYWPAGSGTVTVTEVPINFDWTYAGRDPTTNARISGATKRSGLVACITADEWNELVDAVNKAKGTSISHVSKGAIANARSVVNPVAKALGVTIPNGFSASFFNSLRTEANELQ